MVAAREDRRWEYDEPADSDRCHISGECKLYRCMRHLGPDLASCTGLCTEGG
jgi:hypothetical protein